MTNVISHPAFEREPVINERRRGRPAGMVTLAMHRRKKDRDASIHTMFGGDESPSQTNSQREAQQETLEEKSQRLNRQLDEVSWHLLQAARIIAGKRNV